MNQLNTDQPYKNENWNGRKLIIGTCVCLSLGLSTNLKTTINSKEYAWVGNSHKNSNDGFSKLVVGNEEIKTNTFNNWKKSNLDSYELLIVNGKIEENLERRNKTMHFIDRKKEIVIVVNSLAMLLSFLFTVFFIVNSAGFGMIIYTFFSFLAVPFFFKVIELFYRQRGTRKW